MELKTKCGNQTNNLNNVNCGKQPVKQKKFRRKRNKKKAATKYTAEANDEVNATKQNTSSQMLQASAAEADQVDAVDLMTSRDFRDDIDAHIQCATQQLKDKERIRFFENAILYNRHIFRGRNVLVLRCGLGILALFAAKAGAACVYAIDHSNVTDYTRRVVAHSKYNNIIQVIKGRVQDIELPTQDKLDIIICNWVGYSLLYESECVDLIKSRDKWLKRDGIILPDIGRLYLAGLTDSVRKSERFDWWVNVRDFNMCAMRKYALLEPVCQQVDPNQLLSKGCLIKTINMYKATIEDLKFRSKFCLQILRPDVMDALVTYFEVDFSNSHKPMTLSTAPWEPIKLQWLQSVYYFDKSLPVNKDDVIYGGFEMYSTSPKCDLNTMTINCELYRRIGDRSKNSNLDIISRNRWLLRKYYDENVTQLLNEESDDVD